MRCQVHKRVEESAFNIYMPNKCHIEKNIENCFIKHKGKEYLYQKDFYAFKNTKEKEKYF